MWNRQAASEPSVNTCTWGRSTRTCAANDCAVNKEPSTDLSCKLPNQREVMERSCDLATLSISYHFWSGILVCVKMPVFSHLNGAVVSVFPWTTLGSLAPAPKWRHLNKVPHLRSVSWILPLMPNMEQFLFRFWT